MHVWKAAGIMLLISTWAILADSQQPTPGPSITGQRIQDHRADQNRESDTDQAATNPSSQPFASLTVKPNPDPNEKAPNDPGRKHNPAPTNSNRLWFPDPNWIIALLTLALFLIAFFEWRLDEKTNAHNIATERAYVAISHSQRTREFNAGRLDLDEEGAVFFEVDITNHGHTPADILGGIMAIELGKDGSSAPLTIPSGRYQPIAPSFLVPGSHIRMMAMVFGFDPNDLRRAFKTSMLEDPSPPLEMWLVGFVFYRDVFGGEHCGSYARHWNRETADLVFDTTTAHLNYDRPPSDHERKLSQPRKNG